MAESKAPYSYLNNGDGIEKSLSSVRFAPYLKSAGYNREYAFNLYLYNARLAKAFLFPLHILEITLRNTISDLFTNEFGPHWHLTPALTGLLNPQSLTALNKAQERAKSPALQDVVAELSFDFWSNLFRDDYDRDLWQTRMDKLLPNQSVSRKELQVAVRDINRFRNRIAHHEPIHKLNLTVIHRDILSTLGWFSVEITDWVRHYSTALGILRTAPSAISESKPHFADRADNDFTVAPQMTPLSKLPASRFVVCHDEEQSLIAVVERQHIANYLLSKAEEADLMLDLSAHYLVDVINMLDLKGNCIECGANESLIKAGNLLKRKVEYILVNEPAVLRGVIAKAHRRY
ncbi:hypothetical protein [Aeromonas veronii]|uniref:hypothetical protein n=1 Tax=Aeromonas veronii TaxID=654 RepID=UPI003BA0F73E